MSETDPDIVLDEFRASLKRIKSLIAWQQLKQSETRPDQPATFVMYDSTQADLNNEYSQIIAVGAQMQTVLKNRELRTIRIVRTRREYLRLKQELNALNVPARLKGLL